jgi:diadenosine tetraphosphate (Ap4A) HIT family hydrolase
MQSTAPVGDRPGCLGCDLLAGRQPLPGGIIHQTPRWAVNHAVGPLNLGTLVIAPREHIVSVADLDSAAAGELGPLLRQAAIVIEQLCQPEQVYVGLWSHGAAGRKHLHFVAQPVTGEVRLAYGGLRSEQLQAAMMKTGQPPPAAQVETFCAEARRRWA